jgi:hypothetical protein
MILFILTIHSYISVALISCASCGLIITCSYQFIKQTVCVIVAPTFQTHVTSAYDDHGSPNKQTS